jgi:hypothetical protein
LQYIVSTIYFCATLQYSTNRTREEEAATALCSVVFVLRSDTNNTVK